VQAVVGIDEARPGETGWTFIRTWLHAEAVSLGAGRALD
jgi:hypothetical protein